MNAQTVIANLDSSDVMAALIHHVLAARGITYSGPILDFVERPLDADSSGRFTQIRVEVTIDPLHIVKQP